MRKSTTEGNLLEATECIESAAVRRYSDRLQKFGDDPRTLGWDTRENQRIRFNAVADVADMEGKSVLDIGCGFADFYAFLEERGVRTTDYIGIDINQDLLDVAKSRYPSLRYEQRNLMLKPYDAPVADTGVMLGLLNFRLKEMDNYTYAQEMIESAFAAVRESLVVDFLSATRIDGYPEESFVFYFEPEKILSYALTLTKDVVLKHDYAPIPQKEFMIVLRK